MRFESYNGCLKDLAMAIFSLSGFFANRNGNCPRDPNGFYQLKCISGLCNDCSLVRPYKKDDFCEKKIKLITLTQYVVEKYTYKNKEGKQVEGSRTVQQTFSEDFKTFESKLYEKQYPYLLHQYECFNDIHHWPLIMENGLGYCFHMDYSENLSFTPKHEPQDSHFNNQQLSLHCTVVHPAEDSKNFQYAYHISNDKRHDFAFTSNVIEDLLKKYDEHGDYPVIRFKSDNCSVQYCCKSVFPYYRDLAVKENKPVVVYYGVNGHGCGLVDAMSGFGVKTIV